MTERSLRLVGVVAPTPRRATSIIRQSSIVIRQFRFCRVGLGNGESQLESGSNGNHYTPLIPFRNSFPLTEMQSTLYLFILQISLIG